MQRESGFAADDVADFGVDFGVDLTITFNHELVVLLCSLSQKSKIILYTTTLNSK